MPSGTESPGPEGIKASAAVACLSSMATRKLLAEFGALFEAATGHVVVVTSIGGVDAARRVRAGEPADVVVLAKPVMAALETEGHLVPGSCIDLALSETVLAVRASEDHPNIGSEDALRRALLAAPRIGFSTGPSGDHLLALLARWGVQDTIGSRLVKAPPGVPVGELLASGAASLGLQQRSELMNIPGVEIVGPLPPGAEATTTFTAGVAAASARAAVAAGLISFIANPTLRERYRQHGMEAAAS